MELVNKYRLTVAVELMNILVATVFYVPNNWRLNRLISEEVGVISTRIAEERIIGNNSRNTICKEKQIGVADSEFDRRFISYDIKCRCLEVYG